MGTLTYYDPATGSWITTEDDETGSGVQLTDGIIETRYLADLAVTDNKVHSVHTSKLIGTLSGTILDDHSISWSKLDIGDGISKDQFDQNLIDYLNDTQLTAEGGHALAMGKNSMYFADDPPTIPYSGDDFVRGDMWIDTNDSKKLYIFDGSNWVIARDEDIDTLLDDVETNAHRAALSANGSSTVYRQDAMPTGGTYYYGDVWFDTALGKVYIWDGEIWYNNPIVNSNGSIPIGKTGFSAFYQPSQPTGSVYLVGDRWFDTDDNYKQYTYTKDGWLETTDAYRALAAADVALVAANGKNKVIYSTANPSGTGFVDGDMWYKTGTNASTGDVGVITLYVYDSASTPKWQPRILTDSVLGNITANRITVGVLNGNLIEANTLIGDRIKANSLDASKIIAGSITADSAIFAEGAIQSAWIGEAQIGTAHISSIDAYKISAAWLDVTGQIKTHALSADVIDVDTIRLSSIASAWGDAIDISSNEAITLLARKDSMISYINLSPEGVTIHGDKIDINGALTLSNWADASDYTKISGGAIATRTISVDKVTPNFGEDLDISANTAINLRVTKEEFFDAVKDLVKEVDVEYYLSTSAATPTGGSWQTNAPPFQEDRYMWTRTKTTYQDGRVTYEPSETGTPISGATGQPGVGIANIKEEYYSSSSATDLVAGQWQDTAPAWNSDRYIWTRSVITYTDGTTYTTPHINATGSPGGDGADGESAVVVMLSNESMALPSSSSGAVSSYAGTGTEIHVYEGATELTYDGSGTTNGTWRVSAVATGITPSSPVDAGLFARYGNHSNMTDDAANVIYSIAGKRLDGKAINFVKTQSLTKARAGVAGSTGVSMRNMGNWNSSTTYVNNSQFIDVVSHNGATYMVGTTNTNSAPPNANWNLIAQNGTNGTNGTNGQDGTNGKSYVLNIQSSVGGFMYNADGISPQPALTPLTATLYEDGQVVSSGITYEWSVPATGSLLSMPASSTSATFTPNRATTYDAAKGNNIVTLRVTYAGQTIVSTYSYSVGRIGSQGIQGPKGTDGQTTYTWIKYSPVASPVAGQMTDLPDADSKYMGIAYNKTVSTESTTPGDYQWSLIRGEGVPGTDGADGKTMYTWVKYANDENGGGMSDDPVGKSFIGLAYNKEDSTESSTASDYQWARIKGDSAVVGTLSNDSAVVPASSTGTVLSTGGASTTMSIFEGSNDISAGWTYTHVASGGTFNGAGTRSAQLLTMTADTATLTITASRPNYSNVVSVFTVTKAKAGADGGAGQNSTAYWLVSNTSAIGRSKSDTYTPTTITLTAKSQTGTATPANYSGRFKIETLSGTTWTTRYTSAANESTTTWTVLSGIAAVRTSLYLAGGTTTLLDEEIIPVVADGADGVNGDTYSLVLDGGVRSISYDENGNRINPPAGAWTARLFMNGVQVTSGITYTWTAGGHLSGSSTSSSFTPTYAATYTANSSDFVKLDAKHNGNTIGESAAVSVTKTGVSYTILLSNESHAFPGSSTSALAGSTETTVSAFRGSTPLVIGVGAMTTGTTGLTASVVSGNNTVSPLIRFTATTALTATSGFVDIPLTIDGVSFSKRFSWSVARAGSPGADGAPAPIVNLTATTQALIVPQTGTTTVPATATVTGSFQNATGTPTWEYSSNGAAFTTVRPAGLSAPTAGHVITVTGSTMTASTIAIRMSIAGASDTITIAKVADGAPGVDAKLVTISYGNNVFKSNDGGITFEPADIVLTPTYQGVSFSSWQYSINGGSTWVNIPTSGTLTYGLVVASTGARALTVGRDAAPFNSATTVTFKVNAGTVSDTVTIAKLYDVADIEIGGRNVAANTGYRLEGTKKVGNEEVPNGVAESVFSAQAQRVNLVPNPSFELGASGSLTDWTPVGCTASRSTGGSRDYDGLAGGLITADGTQINPYIASAHMDVDPGTRMVTFGVDAWAEQSDTEARMTLQYYSSTGTYMGALGTSWTKVQYPWSGPGTRLSRTEALPDGVGKVRLYIWGRMDGGADMVAGRRWMFDKATVEIGTTDGSWFNANSIIRTNALSNPSFESNLSGWQTNFGTSTVTTSYPQMVGRVGTRIAEVVADGTNRYAQLVTNPRVSIPAGAKFATAGGWVAGDLGSGIDMGIELWYYDSAGASISGSNSWGAYSWYTGGRLSVTSAVPPTAATAQIRLTKRAASGALLPSGNRTWWDGITLEFESTDGSWFESDQHYVAPFIDDNEIYNGNRSLKVQASVPGSFMQNIRHLVYDGLELNEDVILSFFVKGTAGKGNVDLVSARTDGVIRQFDITSNWTKIVLPLGKLTSKGLIDESALSIWFQNAGVYWLNSIKLESGNKHTRWTPAPEDNDSEFKLLTSRVNQAELRLTEDAIMGVVTSRSEFTQPLIDLRKDVDNAATITLVEEVASSVVQTAVDWSVAITAAKTELRGEYGKVVEDVTKKMTFDLNGLTISGSNNFKATFDANSLTFFNSTTPVAWITDTQLYIKDAVVENSIRIGKHIASTHTVGSTSITVFRNI